MSVNIIKYTKKKPHLHYKNKTSTSALFMFYTILSAEQNVQVVANNVLCKENEELCHFCT